MWLDDAGGFFIGTDYRDGEDFLGLIEEVAVWDGALTSDQVRAHYDGTLHDLYMPEPVTLALFAASAGAVGLRLRRRRR